jgi:hypothetical protein
LILSEMLKILVAKWNEDFQEVADTQHVADQTARRCPVGAGHDGREIPDQVRDEEGKVRDEEGKVRDEEGKGRDEEGKVRDEEGKVRDEEGQVRDEEGKDWDEEGRDREMDRNGY